MALNQLMLVNGLRSIMDQDYVGFVAFPSNNVEMADAFADIINNYASLITPISATSEAARSVFFNTMLSIDVNLGNGVLIITSALVEYASILSLGMLPAFTATPPPIPPQISTIIPSLGLAGNSSSVIAESLGLMIDTWFRTGTAINTTSFATTLWL